MRKVFQTRRKSNLGCLEGYEKSRILCRIEAYHVKEEREAGDFWSKQNWSLYLVEKMFFFWALRNISFKKNIFLPLTFTSSVCSADVIFSGVKSLKTIWKSDIGCRLEKRIMCNGPVKNIQSTRSHFRQLAMILH